MAANVTPARSTPGAHGDPLRTPGSAGAASPDVSQLVQRLQVLRSRLSTMTATLEHSVAAASPLRGKADEEILYSTPKLVSQLLDGPIGQDASLLLAPGAPAPAGTNVTEVRFTLSASSEEELDALVELLQLQDEHGVSERRSHPCLPVATAMSVHEPECLSDACSCAGRGCQRQDVRMWESV
jgi:hypothetical protein